MYVVLISYISSITIFSLSRKEKQPIHEKTPRTKASSTIGSIVSYF
jgi:hypothetical protein